MRAALVVLGVALACAGCETRIFFVNKVPNATIANVRWVTEGDESVYTSLDVELLPGQRSRPIDVWDQDRRAAGEVRFELAVRGSQVSLATAERLSLEEWVDNEVEIVPELEVRNVLLEE